MEVKENKTWSIVGLIGIILTIGILVYDVSILSQVDALEKSGGNILFNYRGIILVSGIVLIILGAMKMPSHKHNSIVNTVFLLPVLMTFFITVLLPFGIGIFYSFTDWNGLKFEEFVGLANYLDIFGDAKFRYSFFITFIFTVLNVVIVNAVAFALALMVTSNLRGANFYKAAYFVPNLIGGIVLGYVWQFVFNRVIPQLLGGEVASMLTNPNLALAAIIIVSTWQYGGYIMMLYVTGLQSVPKSVLEASSIDGATYPQTLRFITMPMIANSFTVCLFLTIVNSFKQFDLNFAITNGGPIRIVDKAAMYSTEFLALNIYKTAITENNYSAAQAKAVIFFIIIASVSLLQVSINKRKEIEA